MGYLAMTTHLQRSNDGVSYKSLEKHTATVNTAATTTVRERRLGSENDTLDSRFLQADFGASNCQPLLPTFDIQTSRFLGLQKNITGKLFLYICGSLNNKTFKFDSLRINS